MAEVPMSQDLADSIAMLEQILEVMPQDTEALKALYKAYLQSGMRDRAFEYLNRMVEVVVGGGDPLALDFVTSELQRFDATHPSEVAAQRARLRILEIPERASVATAEPEKNIRRAEVDISEELSLAWRLYEENQFSQEEYSSVLHDLTEISSQERHDVPVTVSHVLNDRGFARIEHVMSHLSARSGMPYVSLTDFEFNERAAKVLPMERAARDGVMPFGFFGNDLLVCVLNPFNKALIDEVERECGHRCHAYLVDSLDYDAALGRLRATAA